MPLPSTKDSTPFQTMDIKTALLASGTRKRKAASPQICKNEIKSLKLSSDKTDSENDIEIIDETCSIKVDEDLKTSLGDCKENKDINASEELNSNVNNCFPQKLKNSSSPMLSETVSDINDVIESEKSKESDKSSCDELNSSILNSSVNILNTSGISVTGDEEMKETSADSKTNEDNVNEKNKNCSNKLVKEKIKKKMTPAEAKKRSEERELKQKERLLKKQELENKKRERMLEKERAQKERLLRKEREELERKERERLKQEKKEQEEKERMQKQKEKEEKNKIKQMLLEQKLEEKKRREEMKKKQEEEKKKAEEEKLKAKLEKEQKEREKKEKAKAAFVKFFLKGDNAAPPPAPQVTEKDGAFLPFQISDNMILAPVVPLAAQERFNKTQLDHYLQNQDGKELYLQILKSGSYKDVRLRKRNKKFKDFEADVIVIDTKAEAELGLRAKLFQFSENVRPPYWGTWRKTSKVVRPRNPWGQDEIFDYSVDSDDEWDEGGPGESLSGTENEDESEDDYEVDNEFFVPHGYLSDEEERKEDDDEEVNDPEKQKALLKLKLQEFEMERKKKTTELKPIILGCYFENDSRFQDNGLRIFLQAYAAEIISEGPIPTSFNIKQLDISKISDSPNSNKTRKRTVPEKAFPHLIRLVHANVNNVEKLAKEFQKYWMDLSEECPEMKQDVLELPSIEEVNPLKDVQNEVPFDFGPISLKQIRMTVKSIATYGRSPDPNFNKCCWWVNDDIRKKYNVMDAPVPNQWNYVLKFEEKTVVKCKIEEKPVVKNNSGLIKGFLSTNEKN